MSDQTDFTGMFEDAANFNQDIGFLDFSSAATLTDMFKGADKYRQDMSGWNTPATATRNSDFATTDSQVTENNEYPEWFMPPSVV